jgi:hypothetical protein
MSCPPRYPAFLLRNAKTLVDGQTSAGHMEVSRTVTFEFGKLFLLAIQSLPKNLFEGTGVSPLPSR